MGDNLYSIDSIINNPDFNLNSVFSNNRSEDDDDELTFEQFNNQFITNYCDTEQFLSNVDTTGGLIVMSLNVQSLASKFDSLCSFITELKGGNKEPDLICLQEVWNVPEFVNFDIPGFHSPLFKTRSNNTKGGGVTIYVNTRHNFTWLDNSIFVERVLETIFVEIKIKNTAYTFGSLYHPPHSPHLTENKHFTQFIDLMSNLCDFLS